MAITLEELQIKFSAETGALKSQLSGVQNQLGGLEKSADKSKSALAGMMKGGLAVAGALAARKLVQFGKDSLDMANDVVESEQLFSESMGKMESSARAWSESMSASLGLNAYDLRKNVGMLNVMFGSMGLGEQEAYDMSTSLTKLANDMASFYNLDTEEAFTKLRAGITGETEPLKRLGILVDEQTVAQYALKSGISKTGKELTQQQKLQARYGAIMEQTSKAQGDLARTMDSPTNQLRRLNAEFDLAKIALGQALQPALIAVLPALTGFARGLTNVLKGGSGGDPLSGTINDLAGATAAIKSRVDTSIVDIVANIALLQEGTETAVDGYIQAASETRDLYININLKPKNTVYMRILSIFTQLNKQIDTAQTLLFKDEIKSKMDVILQDGVVTGPERQSLLAYLTEIEEKLREEAREKLKAVQAEANYKLSTGEIDLPTADQMLIDAQTAYDTSIGVIEGLIAEAKAEVNIKMKPPSNVYGQINGIFAILDSRINTVASRTFKDGVQAQLDIIMQDGKVTGPERQSLLAYLMQTKAYLKKEAEEKLKAVQADADYKLSIGEINGPTHDQMLADAQTEYDTTIGTIDSLIAEAEAIVDVSDYTASTISAADRTKMANAINKEIAAGEALLVSANAQVQALFEGSSLEQAVLGMYGDLTGEINANNAEINELLTAWLDEDDGAAFEKAMAKREENKKLLAIATGGLDSEGKINKGLMAIGNATPEEITNFAKGYAETLKEMTAGYIERGTERENVLYNMPDSYFAKQGKTRKQMIDENTAETNAAIAQTNAMLLKSATEGIGPQIGKILNDPNAGYAQTLDMSTAISDLLNSIDIKGLDAAGAEQYAALEKMLSDLDALMVWQQNRDVIPFPGSTNPTNPWQSTAIPELPPKLTQFYDPMAHENKGYVFSGADITIDKPKMQYKSMTDGSSAFTGRGGEFGGTSNVNVAVETSDVTLTVDGRAIAAAVIKYLPKVQAQIGKPVYSYGGRNIDNVMVLDR